MATSPDLKPAESCCIDRCSCSACCSTLDHASTSEASVSFTARIARCASLRTTVEARRIVGQKIAKTIGNTTPKMQLAATSVTHDHGVTYSLRALPLSSRARSRRRSR